jgi:hypothetical protein
MGEVQPLLAIVSFVMPMPVDTVLSSVMYKLIKPEISCQWFWSGFGAVLNILSFRLETLMMK